MHTFLLNLLRRWGLGLANVPALALRALTIGSPPLALASSRVHDALLALGIHYLADSGSSIASSAIETGLIGMEEGVVLTLFCWVSECSSPSWVKSLCTSTS
jgi:hypothetical protein